MWSLGMECGHWGWNMVAHPKWSLHRGPSFVFTAKPLLCLVVCHPSGCLCCWEGAWVILAHKIVFVLGLKYQEWFCSLEQALRL